MSKLIISVSGIRGIVGKNLFPETAQRFGLAFGTYIKGTKKIVMGCDTRITRDMMKAAVISGLLGTGCEVIDVDIAPTPTVQYLVREMGLEGGIVISASHNPIEWNALKLYKKGGVLLNKGESEKIKHLFESQKFNYAKWDQYKTYTQNPLFIEKHINRVLQFLNIKNIIKKKYTVALDSCNASGSYITPQLLHTLGCDVKGLYVQPNGYFPHNPEPNAKNLQDLMQFMKKIKCDVGFAQDSDADRLAILDERGYFLSEEYTTALAVYYILTIYAKNKKLKKYNKSVVVNLSTSRMIDDIGYMFGVQVYRTAVGEINVVEKLIKTNSVIGGEGNGGVIFPEINYGRDSLAGMGLVLDYMAHTNEKISSLLNKIPHYIMHKTKFNIENINVKNLLHKIKKEFSKGKINEVDGLKIDFPDFWFHIRLSNTEPIMRLIVEAREQKTIDYVIQKISNKYKL